MLLFHKQVKLVKAIHYGAILLLIITERFAKADEGKAAFVFNFVAHGVECKVTVLPGCGKQKYDSYGQDGNRNHQRRNQEAVVKKT
jgi:hypothetical protein